MRVGTSIKSPLGALYTEDHPHACGDKYMKVSLRQVLRGSSPCVWGQVTEADYTFALTGIIPMRVGTRDSLGTKLLATRDHPHACGDKTKEIKENSGFAKSTA